VLQQRNDITYTNTMPNIKSISYIYNKQRFFKSGEFTSVEYITQVGNYLYSYYFTISPNIIPGIIIIQAKRSRIRDYLKQSYNL